MKLLNGLTIAASMLLAAQAATAAKVDADKSKAAANPAQKKVRAVTVMSPEQAKAALGRGACMARCAAN